MMLTTIHDIQTANIELAAMAGFGILTGITMVLRELASDIAFTIKAFRQAWIETKQSWKVKEN